jgi:hypothetical protein
MRWLSWIVLALAVVGCSIQETVYMKNPSQGRLFPAVHTPSARRESEPCLSAHASRITDAKATCACRDQIQSESLPRWTGFIEFENKTEYIEAQACFRRALAIEPQRPA